MTLVVAQAKVEAVCVETLVITRQLNAVTTVSRGVLFCSPDHQCTNALAAAISAHVHRFNLGGFATASLEVPQNENLADANDFTIILSHEHDSAVFLTPFGGGPVLRFARVIFRPWRERSANEELYCFFDVIATNRSNSYHFFFAFLSSSIFLRSATNLRTSDFGSGVSRAKCKEPFVCSYLAASGIRLKTEPLIG